MPGWLNISGIFGSVGNALDLGYRFTARKAIKQKDATVLLEEINKILLMTTDTLELYKDLLPPSEYATFLAEHRVLQLKLQEESAHQRDFNDALIQHGRVPSNSGESKETIRVRAAYLLGETEVYQNKVIRASRRAHTPNPSSFPDEEPRQTNASSTTSCQPTPSSRESPVASSSTGPLLTVQTDAAPIAKLIRSSVLRSISRPLHESLPHPALPHLTLSAPTAVVTPYLKAHDDLLIAITHIRDQAADVSSQAAGSTKSWYRRVLSVRDGSEVIDVVDPQLYELADDQVSVDEQVMRVLHRATEKWMAKKLAEDID
ncbi:hypothetical protein RhiJN_00157 [Ceratobasidium sp. AG-Ba]|nr:hypothetical protein RhiJN_00157 [Ceratobasidium sp. AG-Ba]QRW01192.1 hypothetical protein RhiLY_00189 [Ceratobasidium sp. AG-Ba]